MLVTRAPTSTSASAPSSNPATGPSERSSAIGLRSMPSGRSPAARTASRWPASISFWAATSSTRSSRWPPAASCSPITA